MYQGIPFPNLDPVALHLGFFSVRWYSLAYIFGILIAWLLARRMSTKTGSSFTVLKLDDYLIWGTIGIVLGGRLGYILFYNPHYFYENFKEIFAIWHGGMSFHGGLIGVVVATVLFAYKRHISSLVMGDILVCVAPVGLFFGRLANFVNGELFGRVTYDVPWAMIFPDGGAEPRHPSQLYEALGEGVVLFCLLNAVWWGFPTWRHRRGSILGLFLVLYSGFRFFVEYTREPDEHLGLVWSSFSMGQLLCFPMALMGIGLLLYTSSAVYAAQVTEAERKERLLMAQGEDYD